MLSVKFEECNTTIAKNQPEYLSLPGRLENGCVVNCFQLNKEELDRVLDTRKVRIAKLAPDQPAMPTEVRTIKPSFPIDPTMAMNCNGEWDEARKMVTLEFDLSDIEIAELKKNNKLWIITANFGAPIQPIAVSLL